MRQGGTSPFVSNVPEINENIVKRDRLCSVMKAGH
jgi:hypothetical protein